MAYCHIADSASRCASARSHDDDTAHVAASSDKEARIDGAEIQDVVGEKEGSGEGEGGAGEAPAEGEEIGEK